MRQKGMVSCEGRWPALCCSPHLTDPAGSSNCRQPPRCFHLCDDNSGFSEVRSLSKYITLSTNYQPKQMQNKYILCQATNMTAN